MKIYSVHRLPGATEDEAVFIKEGFSWPAFLLTLIWLGAKRLWLPLAAYVFLMLAISTLSWWLDLPESLAGILPVIVSFWFGLEGNDMLRRALARRAYVEQGVVIGRNRVQAELRYFSELRRSPPAIRSEGVEPVSGIA